MKTSTRLRASRAVVLFMLAAFPILILILNQFTDLDLVLADLVFDPAERRFPWRHAWLTDTFGHVIMKYILIALASVPILLCIWDLARPIRRCPDGVRLRMRVVALSAVCVPLLVSAHKSVSAPHCPWDIDRYGGAMPYIRLLESLPAGVEPGHCFPAGHATSALWMVSIALFWWPHKPRTAVLIGFFMLSIGFALGWMQQMRGAHFFSHTLWSVWTASAVTVGIFVALRRLSRRCLNQVGNPR